jgi:hypothetical protein
MIISRRIPWMAVGVSIAVLALAALTGGAAAKASPCSTTFTVLHNDRSGGVQLPAGLYRITSSTLGCLTASNFFKTFLAKYNAAIPGWKGTALGTGNGTYRRNSNGTSFTVKLVKRKSGGGSNNNGGGGGGGNSSTCTTTFTVLHNDRSGGVQLPAGLYRVTSSTLSCFTASNFFKTFLAKYNGAIPGWRVTALGAGSGTYRRNSNGTSFTVKLIKKN